MTLLDELLEAHGGAHALDEAQELHAELRTGGPAFQAHGGPAAFTLRVRADPRRPRVTFADFLHPGRDATFTPGRTTVGDEARDDARGRLGGRRLRWDDVDLATFCGAAVWSYLTTPWLLLRPGVAVRELSRRRLEVTFPPELPAHSPRQVVHLDPVGRLARVDYTAQAIGPWARAAHTCAAHARFGPVIAPTRRRVTPRLAGRALPGPALVRIELDALEVR